jgi:hypothetical protein
MGGQAAGRRGVELRVHGVGGDPPHTVLGMPFREDAIPDKRWSTPGRVPVSHRRGDPDVRVYEWGDLTSRSPWFALWTLLLPCTLMNVAGWAGRPWRPALVPVQRALAFICGLVLTSLTVSWLALSGVLGVPESWSPGVGLGLAAVVTIVLGVCATFVSYRYGRHRPPWWPASASDSKILAPPPLSDPRFFDTGTAQRRAWYAHVVVAIGTWAAIGWSHWRQGVAFQPHLERGIAWATLVGLGLVVLLAIVTFEFTLSPADWRWSPGAMAAAAAFFITGGVPSAALIARNGGLKNFRGGDAFVFLDAYGAAVLAAIASFLVLAVVTFFGRSPAEIADREERPDGELLLRSSAASRGVKKAQVVRHIDLVTSAAAGTFVVGGIIAFVVRIPGGGGLPRWVHWPGSQLVWLAQPALGIVVAFVVRDVWRNSRSLDRRRKIGQIWDILTFWPRTIHPFAVRPYSERAVPELQEYLSAEGPEPIPSRWAITAHSQGSVLTYAALVGLPTECRGPAPIDFLTFGCPLTTLFAKAFPSYFRVSDFDALRLRLEGPGQGGGSWLNVFRATDPIGGAVFDRTFGDRNPLLDRALPDPNREEPADDTCPDGDYDLPIDGKIWGHSGYRRTRRLKALVRESRQRGDDGG